MSKPDHKGCVCVTGAAGGPPEFSRGIAGFDWNGAMINLEALLTALYVRNRTGRGTRQITISAKAFSAST